MRNKHGELPNPYDLNIASQMWGRPKTLDVDAIRRGEKLYAKKIAMQCLAILENNHKKNV